MKSLAAFYVQAKFGIEALPRFQHRDAAGLVAAGVQVDAVVGIGDGFDSEIGFLRGIIEDQVRADLGTGEV